MNTEQGDLAASGASGGAPLIGFAQDVVRDYHPETDPTRAQQPFGAQAAAPLGGPELQPAPSLETTSQWAYSSGFPPARSIRELVECLGSPVCSNTSGSPPGRNTLVSPRASRPSTMPPSPSLFHDPASFGEREPSDLLSAERSCESSISSCDQDLDRPLTLSTNSEHLALPAPFGHVSTLEQSLEQDHEDWPPRVPLLPSQYLVPRFDPPPARPAFPSPLNSPTLGVLSEFPSNHPDFPNPPARSQPPTRPLPRAPSPPAPSHAWNRSPADPFTRPDRFSRTTAHTTISDILFNFDLDAASATDLIDDACQTARQVGVSTHDLLSRTVFLGASDLGVTPLCLEASRVDVEGGLELVLWLIENSRPGEVYAEVKRGCLMRRNGMGEQGVWNVLRSFVPSVDGEVPLAYDVEVEPLAVVPGGYVPRAERHEEDDEGSLYDDVSIIDADSGFLDEADIETLKSSSDEGDDKGKATAEDSEPEPEPEPSRVHRARIVMPEFKECLMGPSWSYTHLAPSNRFGLASSGPLRNKVLTAEWIFEGRLWALSIGEERLILTLRETSHFVSPDPVHVKAIVRVLPPDIQWTGVDEMDHIGTDRLLPTQTPNDVLLPSPLYECEFEEKVLVPGPVRVGSSSSVWRTDIRVSMFSLLELVEPHNGIKIEVVLRVVPLERVASTSGSEEVCVDGASVVDDASDWQLVDD